MRECLCGCQLILRNSCSGLGFSNHLPTEPLPEASAPSHQLSRGLRNGGTWGRFLCQQILISVLPALPGSHPLSAPPLACPTSHRKSTATVLQCWGGSCVHHIRKCFNDTHSSLMQSVHVSRPSVLLVFADLAAVRGLGRVAMSKNYTQPLV